MKKTITLLLVCVMLVASVIPASAAKKDTKLQFGDDGEFKVLHICDCQDGFPAQKRPLTRYRPHWERKAGDILWHFCWKQQTILLIKPQMWRMLLRRDVSPMNSYWRSFIKVWE